MENTQVLKTILSQDYRDKIARHPDTEVEQAGTWLLIYGIPKDLLCCKNLGRYICIYVSPSTKWDNHSTYAIGLLRGTNEVIYTKKLEQHLARGTMLNVSCYYYVVAAAIAIITKWLFSGDSWLAWEGGIFQGTGQFQSNPQVTLGGLKFLHYSLPWRLLLRCKCQCAL